VLPHITIDTPLHYFNFTSRKIPHNINLAEKYFNQPGPIDLEIGGGLFYELLLPNRQTPPGHPVLHETVLGWIISGKTPIITAARKSKQTFLIQETNIETNLNRFGM
jgi:hypothetical protein